MDQIPDTHKLAAAGSHEERVAAVGRFYDRNMDAFHEVYGEVIQCFRTVDVSRLLDLQAKTMGLAPGMKVLDAGCGVCGPAIYFAHHYGVNVDAVTISAVQAELARDRVRQAGMAERVRVTYGDYHELPQLFTAATYDVVYFLESFGHSHDKRAALTAAWEMLRPGGALYIKDLFIKEAAIEQHRAELAANVRRINEAYHYEIGDLYDVLRLVRSRGFILCALKTIDIPIEEFENLSIAYRFQELTGIHPITDVANYVFPVDFLELLCLKPWHDLELGSTRYFLQNLYSLQALGSGA